MVKKWVNSHTYELEQIIYLVEVHNKCTKVAVGRINSKPLLEKIHNMLVVEGWYHVWVTKVYHPQTPIYWPDEFESIAKLLWGSEYLISMDDVPARNANKGKRNQPLVGAT